MLMKQNSNIQFKQNDNKLYNILLQHRIKGEQAYQIFYKS